MRPLDHAPALDGLRGAAALAVVLYHFALTTGLPWLPGPLRWLGKLLSVGWIGVDLFFVLSGYLITHILLKQRDSSGYYSAFFARRLLRVVPLYVAFLVAYLWLLPPLLVALGAPTLLPGNLQHARAAAPVLFTYTLNLWSALTGKNIGAALEPVWSLCVEIHFYLLWPVLVRGLTPRSLARFAVAGLGLSAVLRVVLDVLGVSAQAIYIATPTRLDAVLVGTLIASAHWLPGLLAWLRRRAALLGGVCGSALLGIFFVQHAGFDPRAATTITPGYSLVALTAGCLLVACLQPSPGVLARAFSLRPLRILGKYSYAIYMFNLPVLATVNTALAQTASPSFGSCLLTLAVAAPILALLSAGSWLGLERHCLRLKQHFAWTASEASAPGVRRAPQERP